MVYTYVYIYTHRSITSQLFLYSKDTMHVSKYNILNKPDNQYAIKNINSKNIKLMSIMGIPLFIVDITLSIFFL